MKFNKLDTKKLAPLKILELFFLRLGLSKPYEGAYFISVTEEAWRYNAALRNTAHTKILEIFFLRQGLSKPCEGAYFNM